MYPNYRTITDRPVGSFMNLPHGTGCGHSFIQLANLYEFYQEYLPGKLAKLETEPGQVNPQA
jgi:hypothetical protein